MIRKPPPTYASEAELCAHFMEWAQRKGWTPYPETQGWDVLLVAADGAQIGVQAKLALNADVINQALDDERFWTPTHGPDYRAVLVPANKTGKLSRICAALGITVIGGNGPGALTKAGAMRIGYTSMPAFRPDLPKSRDPFDTGDRDWFDLCPAERLPLPEYVPDVAAGVSGPRQLSDWKIKAIKLAILLRRRGAVTRADFAHLKLSPTLWLTRAWLTYAPGRKGAFVAHAMPDFAAMHPRNFAEIEADFEKWAPQMLPLKDPTK